MNTLRSLACVLAGSAVGWTFVGTVDVALRMEGKVSVMLAVGTACMLWSTWFFIIYMHQRDKKLKAILRLRHRATDNTVAEVEFEM